MEAKRVIVTYCDEYGIWTHLAKDLMARLPLKNLVWKPSNNRTTRTINMLDVELKQYSADTAKNLPPVTLLQSPYLNLYFVNCEDNDAYKTTIRQQIRDWIQLVTSKKNQEWLIVHVSNQENSRNATKFLRTSVLDKIKADFNTGKRDRVAQLRMADTEMSEMELWADFTAKMKEGIVTSFDQNVMSFEEDIRRLDSQRQMPGWNYCTFFILKEGLTNAYEMMNLHEEALKQYDELEASFFQILRDNALTWYGKFGGMQDGDDNANLFDLHKKPYRDLIMQNTITVFDFRTYLFGRQCNLLLRLRRPIEICRRALIFIPAFARNVREHINNLTENFLESWIYSACLCIVNECDETVAMAGDDPNMLVMLDGAAAELLQLARQQLDKLGIQHGRLPEDLPFTMSLALGDSSKQEPVEDDVERKPMSEELKAAVSSDEAFDSLYMSVSARAIKGYDGSGRFRSSLLLHGDVAALQFHRKKYAESARILESITWRYGHSRWTVLENELVIKHAQCLRELGDTVKYVEACLTLLRNMDDLKEEDKVKYSTELITMATSRELKQDICHEFSPMFEVKVMSVVDILQDDDGSFLDIQIENRLSKEFEFNKLSLRMVSGEIDDLWFNIRHTTLKPGKNNLRVTCETSASGTYVVEKVQLKVGRLVFLYDFLQESKKRIFRVDSHPLALKAVIKPPEKVTLGETNTFVVHIDSGRNQVSEASMILTPSSEGLTFAAPPTLAYRHASNNGSGSPRIMSEGEIDLENYDAITLPAFGPNESISITVPYECNLQMEQFAKLIVHYLTPNSKRHSFALTGSIGTILPLHAKTSIIWRDDSMNLKIDVSCTGSIPIRIHAAELQHPTCLKDVAQPPFAGETILFPRQHASFVFNLARPDVGTKAESAPVAQFALTYQSLRDDVEMALTAMLEAKLADAQLEQHAAFLIAHVKSHLLRGIDYMSYGMSDELVLPELDVSGCKAIFAHHDPKIRQTLIGILQEVFTAHKHLEYEEIANLCAAIQPQQVSFPIQLPSTQVLTTVELVPMNADDLVVGALVQFHLTVKHSAYWSPAVVKESSNDFYYDILVDYENWLLCGHKRHLFTAKPGSTATHSVSLVPLKTGPLKLPLITVASSSLSVFNQTAYINEAEQVLVKPKTRSSTFFIDQQRGVHDL